MLATLATYSFAQPVTDNSSNETAQRYWQVLLRNPRPGTAFDNWYSGYVDRGELSALTDKLHELTASDPQNANIHILHGLVLRRQGQLLDAANAFQVAGQVAPQRYDPHFLRGKTLAEAQDYQNSIAAFQTAVALTQSARVTRTGVVELYRELGRVQQLAGDRDAARETWQKLGVLFPTDQRVQSQVATWLQQATHWTAALAAWQRAEQLMTDPYARLEAQLAIADIHSQLNDHSAAISVLDKALGRAKPGSWLDRSIRKRIETIHGDNSQAFVDYLRHRSQRRPEELETVLQLSHALTANGDRQEAIRLLQDNLQRASKRSDIRLALIELLRQDKQFDAAVDQADMLVRQNPQDIEFLQLAGQVRLTDIDGRSASDVVDEVLAFWGRIPQVRPDDPQLAARAGELCLQAAGLGPSLSDVSPAFLRTRFADNQFVKAAEEFFQNAINLASHKTVYREYLGRLYHDTGRRQQALATLQQVTSTDSTAAEWRQLADLYGQLGYQDKALSAIQQAVAIAPDDVSIRQKCIAMLRLRGDQEGALRQLDAATARLENSKDIAAALEKRIEILVEAGWLNREIERLREATTQNQEPAWQKLWLLGLAHKSQGDLRRAQSVLESAVALLPNEPRLLTVLAETCLGNKDVAGATSLFARLAELERHRRTTHIGKIVELQLQENNVSGARETAERLFAMPSNRADDYLQRAAMAKMIDEPDRSLEMLRKAVQIEPRDVDARLALAQDLAHRQQVAEAMHHYWSAFPLMDDVTDKASLLQTMHGLNARQFASQIIPRLTRAVEAMSDRESAMCLAQGLLLVGEAAAAVDQLEQILRRNEDDIVVLRRLADIALKSEEYKVAVERLERVAELTDKPDDWRRLLAVHQKVQDDQGCIRVADRLLTKFADEEAFAQLFDSVYRVDPKRAVVFAREGLKRNPHDWRLKFRLTAQASQRQRRQSSVLEQLGETLQTCLADPRLADVAEQRVRANSIDALASARTPSTGQRALLLQLGGNEKPKLNRDLAVFQELSAIHAAVPPFQARRSRGSRRSVGSRSKLNIPNDPFLAALDCVRELGSAGVHEIPRQGLGEHLEWILLRLEILHFATSGQVWPRLDKMVQYAELRPEDPLPHLVRFYEPLPQSDSAEPYISAVRESFAWLQQRNADLATRLSGNYAQQLIFAGQHVAAADVLARHVDRLDSLVSLVDLAPTCLQIEVPGFRERFLIRALELTKAPATIPEDLADVLLVAFSEPEREYKESEWVAVLALLEQHLKTPSRLGRARTVTSPRTFQTGQSQTLRLAQALRNRKLTPTERKTILEYMRRRQVPQGHRSSTQHRRMGEIMLTSNPYLSLYQREILSRALLQAANSKQDRMLLKWLSEKAVEPSATMTQKVAYPVVLWMSEDMDAAAAEFARVSGEYPQDVHLRMLAATAAYESRRLDKAFLLLSDKSLEGSRVESDMVLLRSQVNAALSSLTDYEMGLRCLVAALEHQTVPYLYPFFSKQKRPYPDLATLSAGDALSTDDQSQQARRDSDWLLAGDRPTRSVVILGILDRAWQLDNSARGDDVDPPKNPSRTLEYGSQLERLESLIENNLVLHPRNQELAAIQVLIMLCKGDFSAARRRMTIWNSTAEPSAWTSATTAELARVLCRFDPTEALGYELVCNYIIGNAAGGAAQRGGQLLTDVTYTISDQELASRDGRTSRFWRTFFDTIRKHGNGKADEESAEIATAALTMLGQAAHDTLPDAIGQLAVALEGPYANHFIAQQIGPSLFKAIRESNLHWLTSDRQKALDGLLALTFPDGPAGSSRLWHWYQFPNASQPLKRYSVGDLIVELAVDAQQLPQLRQQLRSNPQKQQPEITALILEAANADSDLATLIPMVAATKKRPGPNPPVWSADLVKELDPDLYMLGVVLRNSGVATLNTGETVRKLAEIPATPFFIHGIKMSSPRFKDPGLRRLNKPKAIKGLAFHRLRQIRELDLTNLAIGDQELSDLQSLTELVTLRLDGSDVTDQVIDSLAKLESLRELSLRRTKVTAAGIKTIREALPECEVIPPRFE